MLVPENWGRDSQRSSLVNKLFLKRTEKLKEFKQKIIG
jgi:hypothetical protein